MGYCPQRTGAIPDSMDDENIFLRIRAIQAKLRAELDETPSMIEKREPLVSPDVKKWQIDCADLEHLVMACNGSMYEVARLTNTPISLVYAWRKGEKIGPVSVYKIKMALQAYRN